MAVGHSSIGYMFRVGGGSSEKPGVLCWEPLLLPVDKF